MEALVGRGPQVNKLEQVSSLGHQMSLAGDWGRGACTVRSHVQRRERGPRAVRSNVSWVTVTWESPLSRQTDLQKHMTENITFPQLRGRMATKNFNMLFCSRMYSKTSSQEKIPLEFHNG